MHGLIFQKLQDFVVDISSASVWLDLKREAGLEDVIFSPTQKYPDEYIENLVRVSTEHFNLNRDEVLEAFGKHMAPSLLELFSFKIDSKWTAIDVIENTEEYIHQSLKLSDPNVETPELKVERESGSMIRLKYDSGRKMIALGIGIIKAIGEHYKEDLNIECHNDSYCTTLLIRSD